MRQSPPTILYAVDCRRGLHARCPHGLEQITGHTRYTVLCACDCHPRKPADLPDLRELRSNLTREGNISGCFNPSLPQLWTHDDGATSSPGRRRLNPLRELVELTPDHIEANSNTRCSDRSQQDSLPSRQADASQPPAAGPQQATSVACAGRQDMARLVAVDQRTKISKALECNGCKEKRQVIEWMTERFYGKPFAQFRLCAVCLLDALRLLLSKNITRQKPQKGEETDGTTQEAPHGRVITLHSAPTRRAVPRQRGSKHIQRAHQRRRRVRNRRRKAK